MIAVRDPEGQWLLYRHGRAPFNEQVSLPYGKLHIGETVAEAASRELLEKTAVKTSLHHAGEAYLIIREDGEILSHMLAHVFTGSADSNSQLSSSVGTPFWGDPDDYAREIMPGTREIIDLVKRNQPFFEEFQLRLSH
jgi:ADP-ribose pyrophosphatase YjhB (NUDIX family)